MLRGKSGRRVAHTVLTMPCLTPQEVRRELPEVAVKFTGIDADVKGILREAYAAKLLMAACTKAGVFEVRVCRQRAQQWRLRKRCTAGA